MISSALLSIWYVFVLVATSPLRLTDDVVISSNFTASLSTASGYFSGLSVVLPLGTILAVFTLVLVVEGFIFGYKLVMWVIKKIPGIS